MCENGNYTEYTDSPDAPCVSKSVLKCDGNTHKFLAQKPFTTHFRNHWLTGTVTFDQEPRISPCGEFTFHVTLHSLTYTVYQLQIQAMTPAGWTAEYPRAMTMLHYTGAHNNQYVWRPLTTDTQTISVTIRANEAVSAANRVYIAVEALGFPEPLVIPVTILG
jgi:hypothetical protein